MNRVGTAIALLAVCIGVLVVAMPDMNGLKEGQREITVCSVGGDSGFKTTRFSARTLVKTNLGEVRTTEEIAKTLKPNTTYTATVSGTGKSGEAPDSKLVIEAVTRAAEQHPELCK